jgi:hypothetical protein
MHVDITSQLATRLYFLNACAVRKHSCTFLLCFFLHFESRNINQVGYKVVIIFCMPALQYFPKYLPMDQWIRDSHVYYTVYMYIYIYPPRQAIGKVAQLCKLYAMCTWNWTNVGLINDVVPAVPESPVAPAAQARSLKERYAELKNKFF